MLCCSWRLHTASQTHLAGGLGISELTHSGEFPEPRLLQLHIIPKFNSTGTLHGCINTIFPVLHERFIYCKIFQINFVDFNEIHVFYVI
jgi:hypothetical protein